MLCCLTEEQRLKTCGYWYTVTEKALPHTAFCNAWALRRWLWERGLRLTEPLPEKRGDPACMRIDGAYSSSLADCTPEEWAGVAPVLGRGVGLQNGDYVETVFTSELDGTVREWKLNPNCKWRKVYDYSQSDERRQVTPAPALLCPRCGRVGAIVNQCGCDPNNMPTRPEVRP
jgi:hypothetical protein